MNKKKRPPSWRLKDLSSIHVGAEVYWHDPDHGRCSRYAIVTGIHGTDPEDAIITLDHGTEVFLHELS